MEDRTLDTAGFLLRRNELYRTRPEFCEAAGISVTWCKYIERGRQPSRRIARDIAAALKWDVDQLYLPDDAGQDAA